MVVLMILFICIFNVFNFLEKSIGIKIFFVIVVYIKKSFVYEYICIYVYDIYKVFNFFVMKSI